MTSSDLRTGRLNKGLKQVEAARRLKVSQPYLAMLENGKRRVTPDLARRAVSVYGLSPVFLPASPCSSVDTASLASELAALGYTGFAYLRPSRPQKPKNPGEVLLAALAQADLEARLVEALPWLVLRYTSLDRDWLVRGAKLCDLQNRLGFVVTLAREVADRHGATEKRRALEELEAALDQSRLAHEDTLCRASMPAAERHWLTDHRSPEAKHWNLLTDWTADALRFAA